MCRRGKCLTFYQAIESNTYTKVLVILYTFIFSIVAHIVISILLKRYLSLLFGRNYCVTRLCDNIMYKQKHVYSMCFNFTNASSINGYHRLARLRHFRQNVLPFQHSLYGIYKRII